MAILPDHVHWQRHTATAQREPGQRVRKSKEPVNTTMVRWTIQHHRPPQARETLTTTQAQEPNHPESDIPCSSSRHVSATRIISMFNSARKHYFVPNAPAILTRNVLYTVFVFWSLSICTRYDESNMQQSTAHTGDS